MNLLWELNLEPPLPLWTGVFALLIGLILGSFAGMLAYRLPRGLPLDKPGSFCPACRKPVGFQRNLPLVSYALLRGRCARCGHRIHWRYPLSEGLCALLALACWSIYGAGLHAWVALLVCATLVCLALIDLEHGLLPDRLTLGLLWAGLAFSLVPQQVLAASLLELPFPAPRQAVAGAIAGYAALWAINQLWRILRKRDGLGRGDMKLVAALGAWTGISGLPLIVGLSAWAGLAVGLTLIVRGRATLSHPLPFGPFLAAGGMIAILWGPKAWLALAPGATLGLTGI
ncbi:prepilin peptidase [Candidatus Foliamicus sp.]